MRFILYILTSILCLGVWPASAEECESTVDMADSLDFRRMHIECDEDSTFSFGKKDESPKDKAGIVTTYSETPASRKTLVTEETIAAKPAPASSKQQSAEAPAARVFNIREPFSLTGGPESAIRGLFAQMASYCPTGWTKSAEWVEAATTGYFLHYQIRCAE